MQYSYQTRGVCAGTITFELDNDIVHNVKFHGGCPGNAIGVASLVEGMTVDEIEQRLSGIRCGFKPTSCPDQLAKAVRAAKTQAENRSQQGNN